MVNNKNTEIKTKLYAEVKDLPIIDYHCHLSAKEIYLDEVFSDIGQLWLAHDHYKWRLMRSYGVSERYITGSETTIKEKYLAFSKVCARAFGNPIKEWTSMELKAFFDIDIPLNEKTAEHIWEKTKEIISEYSLSPQKLIKMSKVEYIATTDDILDDLEYHGKLRDFEVKVTPSFRTDKLLELKDSNFINLLANKTKLKIRGIDSLEKAIRIRLEYFITYGCKFSDVGIELFPNKVAPREEADEILKNLIDENPVTDEAREKLKGYLFVFLGKLYADRGIVMQLHLSALRNPNIQMLNKLGRDTGFDSVGEAVSPRALTLMLNKISEHKLPKTIIYVLNPSMYYPMITLAGSFPGVTPGMAWWFNDHERGITEFLEKVSELGHIDGLIGMITDSRSFLSYVRHSYFRYVLCDFLSSFYDGDNYKYLLEVAKNVSYENAKKLVIKKEKLTIKKYMSIRSENENNI